ncbi:MAG: LysR family transcriptional regulator [Clostridia bacterium]|nr:LysR family transcriptional regulator [Clostridia bacterium]
MEISILAEFVKLVETCNFQETAEQMNISQSALTKHIHKMEEELGIDLFDRSQRSIQLNEYSRRFYPYAKQLLKTYEEGMSSIKEMQAVDKNCITVAYNPLLGQYGVVDILTAFSMNFPHHTLIPVENYNSIELLTAKKCDFAFVSEAEAEGSVFNKMIYKTDHLAVVMRREHPLAGNRMVTLSELENEGFVLHSSHGNLPHDETHKFLDMCERQHFKPNIIAESHFASTMLHYVRNGKGIAVLNRMHIPEIAADLAVVDISPTVRTYLYLLYPRHITANCAKDFLHYMVECCSQ